MSSLRGKWFRDNLNQRFSHYYLPLLAFMVYHLGFSKRELCFGNQIFLVYFSLLFSFQTLWRALSCFQNAPTWRFPVLKSPTLNFSPITSGRFAALTRCHELSGCLVLGTPLLSSWWTAASTWFKAIFVTWIGVQPSEIKMHSIPKIQLSNNSCRPLRLLITTVRGILDLEASRKTDL